MNEHAARIDARAIRDFAAGMRASAGDDLGPMIWRDAQLLAESHIRLEAILYPPDLPQRSDASGKDEDAADLAGPPTFGSTDAPKCTSSLFSFARHALWNAVVWPARVLGFALFFVLACIFGFDALEEM